MFKFKGFIVCTLLFAFCGLSQSEDPFIWFRLFTALLSEGAEGDNGNGKSSGSNDENSEAALIAWNPPDRINEHMKFYVTGNDNEGRPVWYFEFGKWDIRSYLDHPDPEEGRLIERYFSKQFVLIDESIKYASTPEKPVTEFVMVGNMDQYNMHQFSSTETVSFIIKMATKFESMFRNKLHRGYMVNSNFLFESLFAIIKPVLGHTAEKIDLYGSNPKRWKPILIRNIPKDQIPAPVGGTSTREQRTF